MPSDRYQQLTALPPGRFIAKRLGLPESRPLRRYEPGQPALAGPAVIGGDGRMGDTVAATLAALGAEIRQVAARRGRQVRRARLRRHGHRGLDRA